MTPLTAFVGVLVGVMKSSQKVKGEWGAKVNNAKGGEVPLASVPGNTAVVNQPLFLLHFI